MEKEKSKSSSCKNLIIATLFLFSFIILLPSVQSTEWETFGGKPNPYSHSLTGGFNGNFQEGYSNITTSFGSDIIEPIAFSTSDNKNLLLVKEGSYTYVLNQQDLSVFQEINTGALTHTGRGGLSTANINQSENDQIVGIFDDIFKVYEYNDTQEQFNLKSSTNISNIISDYDVYSSVRCSSGFCYFGVIDDTSDYNIVKFNSADSYETKAVTNTNYSSKHFKPPVYYEYNNNNYFAIMGENNFYNYNYDGEAVNIFNMNDLITDLKVYYPIDNSEPRIIIHRENDKGSLIQSYTLDNSLANSYGIDTNSVVYGDKVGRISIVNYNPDSDNNDYASSQDIMISVQHKDDGNTFFKDYRIILEGSDFTELYKNASLITEGDEEVNLISNSVTDITGDGYGKLYPTKYTDFIMSYTQPLSFKNILYIEGTKDNYTTKIESDYTGNCVPFVNKKTEYIDIVCSGSSGTAIFRSNYTGVEPFVSDSIEDIGMNLNSEKKIYIGDHFKEQDDFYIEVTVDEETFAFAEGDLISNFNLDEYDNRFNVSINRSKSDEWTEGDYILLESYDEKAIYDVRVIVDNTEGTASDSFNVQSGDFNDVIITDLIGNVELGTIDYAEIDLNDYFDYAEDYVVKFYSEDYFNCSNSCSKISDTTYRLKDSGKAELLFVYQDLNGTVHEEIVYTITLENDILSLNSNMETPFSEFEELNNSISDPYETEFDVTGENEISENNQEFKSIISDDFESGEIPTRISVIPDFEMPFNHTTIIDLDNHYNNFKNYDLYVDNQKIDGSQYFPNQDNRTLFISKSTGNRIKFVSYDNEETYNIQVDIKNNYGSISDKFTVDIFNNAQNLYDEPDVEPEKDLSDSTFGRIIDQFLSFFPDSEELSTTQKLGFVFISLFLVTFILMLIAYVESGRVDLLMLYLTAFIDSVLLIFFIGIGYVPIGFVIVLGLILIAISYFKFFRGSQGVE